MRMMTSSKLTWETKNNKICDETAALKYIDIEFILYNICFQVFIMSVVCVLSLTQSVQRTLSAALHLGGREEHEQYIL